jgi:serine/threonine protein kinase
VKPENVFLHNGPTGEVVKVLDFGLAKLLGDPAVSVSSALTAPHVAVGTPL